MTDTNTEASEIMDTITVTVPRTVSHLLATFDAEDRMDGRMTYLIQAASEALPAGVTPLEESALERLRSSLDTIFRFGSFIEQMLTQLAHDATEVLSSVGVDPATVNNSDDLAAADIDRDSEEWAALSYLDETMPALVDLLQAVHAVLPGNPFEALMAELAAMALEDEDLSLGEEG